MTSRRTSILFGVCIVWGLVVGAGLMRLWAYADTPGKAAAAPERWPQASRLSRDPQRPTLVLFAHPQCACSRATVNELARLMAHEQGRVTVHVLFYEPEGADAAWEHTDLWRSASAIPGVRVATDTSGREAAAFDASVSGQTLLYDQNGRLAFSGGITFARGHEGDNAGLSAVSTLLAGGRPATDRTAVFGCSMHEAAGSGQ